MGAIQYGAERTDSLGSSAMQNGTGHIVQAIDVSRRYGEGDAAVDALREVSVEFERDRFTAIMGPSGSGKSTLLHVLAGAHLPTAGRGFILGPGHPRPPRGQPT